MSRVVYVTDHPFVVTGDGVFDLGSFHAGYFAPFLAEFDTCDVVGRVAQPDSDFVPSQAGRVSWRGMRFFGLGGRGGPSWHLLGALSAHAALNRAPLRPGQDLRLWLRVPSASSVGAVRWARRHGIAYGVEVAGDPAASIVEVAPLAGRLAAPLLRHSLGRVVAGAAAVTSVNSQLLERFPPAADALTVVVSNARMAPDWFVSVPRDYRSRSTRGLSALTVSALVPVKDLATAIRGAASSAAVSRLSIVGSGSHEGELRRLAATVTSQLAVEFHGQVDDRRQLRELFLQHDVFLNTSVSEGLPRAAIEAMACGLPVVASDGAGLAGHLPPAMQFRSRSGEGLRRVLDRLTPEQLTAASSANLLAARNYEQSTADALKRLALRHLARRSAAAI